MARAKQSALHTMENMPENILRCVGRQHREGAWEILGSDFDWGGSPSLRKWNESPTVAVIISRCTMCRTLKREVMNTRTGAILVSPSYKYPPGYKLPAGHGLKPVDKRKVYLAQELYLPRNNGKR